MSLLSLLTESLRLLQHQKDTTNSVYSHINENYHMYEIFGLKGLLTAGQWALRENAAWNLPHGEDQPVTLH